MLIRTPSEPGSTSFFFGNHANALPPTLNAGKPKVVPSSTSGSLVAIARTRVRLSRFIAATWPRALAARNTASPSRPRSTTATEIANFSYALPSPLPSSHDAHRIHRNARHARLHGLADVAQRAGSRGLRPRERGRRGNPIPASSFDAHVRALRQGRAYGIH